MRRFLPSVLAALSCLLALAGTTQAQCRVDRATGCPGVPAPTCVGEPVVHQTVTVRSPNCGGVPIMLLGAVTDRVTLPVPPMCVRNCRTSCLMIMLFVGGSLSIRMPDLVGLTFCVQPGCLDPRALCLTLAPQMNITIQSG